MFFRRFFSILILGSFFVRVVWGQTYAEEDFNDYKKTSFSKAACDAFVKEGFVSFDKEDPQNTIEFLRKATSLGCQSPLVYFKMAASYEALGSYYSAIQYYDLAKEAFKSANKSHRYYKTFNENYGRALLMMGNEKKAWPLLEKAARTTDDTWLLQLFAEKALAADDYLTAVSYYERLLRLPSQTLSPINRIEINLKLARIFRNQKEDEAAKRYYRQILEIDPENPEAIQFLKKDEKSEEDVDPSEKFEKVFEIFKKSY